MRKINALLLFGGLMMLFAARTSAQDNKPAEPPKPAQSQSQEIWWLWHGVGDKLTAMAEDFPEDKYDFKAQKDERTFAENLIHIAAGEYGMMSIIKGSPMGSSGNQDSLRKKFATKADIVKFIEQVVTDGGDLIKEQGDAGLMREIKYPWGNVMIHVSFAWMGMIEHAGEHFGQLVVYYRVNGMIPPESRPKK